MYNKAEKIIELLQLNKHPEGGYYREIYRSKEVIPEDALPERFAGSRNFGTSIYFLLSKNDISAWHRIKQDEIWHHYEGSQVLMHTIDTKGKHAKQLIGKEIEIGAMPQLLIKQGTWMAAEIIDKTSYVLLGCNTFPGFDFKDFELGSAKQLIDLFPKHHEIILKFAH